MFSQILSKKIIRLLENTWKKLWANRTICYELASNLKENLPHIITIIFESYNSRLKYFKFLWFYFLSMQLFKEHSVVKEKSLRNFSNVSRCTVRACLFNSQMSYFNNSPYLLVGCKPTCCSLFQVRSVGRQIRSFSTKASAEAPKRGVNFGQLYNYFRNFCLETINMMVYVFALLSFTLFIMVSVTLFVTACIIYKHYNITIDHKFTFALWLLFIFILVILFCIVIYRCILTQEVVHEKKRPTILVFLISLVQIFLIKPVIKGIYKVFTFSEFRGHYFNPPFKTSLPGCSISKRLTPEYIDSLMNRYRETFLQQSDILIDIELWNKYLSVLKKSIYINVTKTNSIIDKLIELTKLQKEYQETIRRSQDWGPYLYDLVLQYLPTVIPSCFIGIALLCTGIIWHYEHKEPPHPYRFVKFAPTNSYLRHPPGNVLIPDTVGGPIDYMYVARREGGRFNWLYCFVHHFRAPHGYGYDGRHVGAFHVDEGEIATFFSKGGFWSHCLTEPLEDIRAYSLLCLGLDQFLKWINFWDMFEEYYSAWKYPEWKWIKLFLKYEPKHQILAAKIKKLQDKLDKEM